MNAHKWPRTLTRPVCPVETMNLARMQSAMVRYGRVPTIEEVRAAMYAQDAANDAPSESDYSEAAEFEFYGTAHAAG